MHLVTNVTHFSLLSDLPVPLLCLCITNITIYDRSDHTVYNKRLRVGAAPLAVGRGQIPAVHHKDVKLSELLDVVHSKLDAALDFNVTKVCRVNAAHAAADLLIQKQHRREETPSTPASALKGN